MIFKPLTGKSKGIWMRRDVTYIILLLLLTDLAVLVNISILRQSLPFIFFSIIPGYLVLRIMKLDLGLLEESLLSVGMSLTLLILTGLMVNMTYPIIKRPVSLVPLTVALNLLLGILLAAYYMRGTPSVTPTIKFKNTLIAPALLSFLFPVLTVIGSYLMNTYSINKVLLGILLSIPVYMVVLTILRDKLHHSTYPLVLFNLGLSLLIMNGLPSDYLIGRDIHREFFLFQSVLLNGHWSPSGSINNAYNACLSVTILPAIYKIILNVPAVYIFKFYYGFIGAVMPPAVYLISERILKDRTMAFYAGLLFIFQFSFIYILGWCRQLVALVFFSLAVMVLTSRLRELDKKILFIIFMIGTVFSHYTTAYVFAILAFLIPPIVWVIGRFSIGKPERSYFFGLSVAVLFFAVIFAWYAQSTGAPFHDTVGFFRDTFSSMADFFSADMRNNAERSVIGIGLANIPNFLSVAVHDTVFLIIGVGFLSMVLRRGEMSREYLAAAIISLSLLSSFIILPFVSKGYGGTRLFTQLLVILAPFFVIGIKSVLGLTGKARFRIPITVFILILLFSCVTYLNYYLGGIPYSYAYNSEGERRYESFIYISEVTGAKWLSVHGRNVTINTDAFGYSRILDGCYPAPELNIDYFKDGRFREGYLYLRWVNRNRGLVFIDSPAEPPRFINGTLKMDNVEPIDYYKGIIRGNMIYDNGGAVILGGA
ncbi:DUF2206 domain-containing protein [Methanothermobacter sp. THM-2]|nr:DUF2206 domain-containing protein [Methanothermobacter sp. THM-2]